MSIRRSENYFKILEAITEFYDEHMYSPSIREIMNMTGICSSSTVFSQLRNLQKDGKIQLSDNVSRGIIPCGYKLTKIEEK